MNIAITLGNRLNDDGTPTYTMLRRLSLTLELFSKRLIDKVIVSGGVANPAAEISEAEFMKRYLVEKGINPDNIIVESQSMTTVQNADFSLDFVKSMDVKHLYICSTCEHFMIYNTVSFFLKKIEDDAVLKEKDMRVLIYTD